MNFSAARSDVCTRRNRSPNHSAMDSQALRNPHRPRSDESPVESTTVIHRRTVSNYIWTAIVLIGVAVAAYYLLPVIGGWMSSGMGKRDTMDRPSSMDVRDNLPSK